MTPLDLGGSNQNNKVGACSLREKVQACALDKTTKLLVSKELRKWPTKLGWNLLEGCKDALSLQAIKWLYALTM